MLSTNLQHTHGVQYVRLVRQKTDVIFDKGKYCIEKLCKDLKELRTEIINFEQKEMILLAIKEIKSYE